MKKSPRNGINKNSNYVNLINEKHINIFENIGYPQATCNETVNIFDISYKMAQFDYIEKH